MGVNLSGLINAGTQALGTYEQSKAQAGQQQIGAIMQAIAMQREQQKDALAQAVAQSTIGKNSATVAHLGAQTAAMANPKPKMTPHSFMVDGQPTMGFADPSGKFYDGTGQPVTGKVSPFVAPKPDPIAVHSANRDYDVKHPLPVNPSYTPFQGTDAAGNPVVRPFNSKSGQFGPVADVAPKAAAGAGAKDAKAQTYTDMMNQSLPAMEQLVDRVRPDRITMAMKNPAAGNVGLNQDEQTFLLNFRTALAGALHQESGARLSHEQLEFGINRFAPTVGDTPQTRRQKIAAMREMANERTARVGGGSATAPRPTGRAAAPAPASTPSAGNPFADLIPKRPEDE